MFRFASPEYWLLLLPVAVAAWRVYRSRSTGGLLFSATHRIPVGHQSWRVVVSRVLPGIVLAGLLLGVVAMSRPQTVLSTVQDKTHAVSIEMVTDVSGSMEALDMSIKTGTGTRMRTRLDAVKEVFAEFVERRPDDLVGLVTFGGYASTRAPLTSDHDALLHVLKGVEIPQQALDANGRVLNQEEVLTAIGDALATACARLENAPTKSRIIVLLSDGESNTGIIKPDQAAEVAKQMGVRIYTIGVGTTGRAPFKMRDIFGRETIGMADVVLDEKLLRGLAEGTGGQYYNVRDATGLEEAMEDINKLEKTEIQRNEYRQYNELFPWFLVPGLVLVLTGTTLNMHWTRRIL